MSFRYLCIIYLCIFKLSQRKTLKIVVCFHTSALFKLFCMVKNIRSHVPKYSTGFSI